MVILLVNLLVVALMVACHVVVSKMSLRLGTCGGFARIKLGPLVTDIRGRVNQSVFSVWKAGVHYVRSFAALVSNPESVQQALIRNFMTLASKAWYDTLTDGQRASWNEFASGLEPQEGDAGGILNLIPQNRGIMSGMNAYCMCYTMVRKSGIALPVDFDNSPLGLTPPSAVTDITAIWDEPFVRLTWVDPTTAILLSKIRVWLRSHENIAHRQLLSSTDLTVLGGNPESFRGAHGASLDFDNVPGHYLVQLDCIQPNGLKGPPSTTLSVTVT